MALYTVNGLAQPLCGSYKAYKSDGTTEYLKVGENGSTQLSVALGASASENMVAFVGGGAWGSTACVSTPMAVQGTFTGAMTAADLYAGLVVENYTSQTGARQCFGAMVDLTMASGSSNSGGRTAVLQLSYQDKSDNYTNAMADSMINFYTLDGHCPSLFTCLTNGWQQADVAGEYFVTATNTTIDHALRIYVDNVVYYIGLYDAVSGS